MRAGPRGQLGIALLALIAAACGADNRSAPPAATGTATLTASATPTATTTATATPSASPTPTATPDLAFGDPLSGGSTTVFNQTISAFGQPARNLPLDQRTDFFVGNALFNRSWVSAPSSTVGSDGLGPLFNARSCSSCHFRDGRGSPPLEPGEPSVGLLFRLSVPGATAEGAALPEPSYGGQLNQQAILGVPPEGRVAIAYDLIAGTYGDGDPYELRAPIYTFEALGYGPLADDALVSPRTAPFLIGLGLLAAIDEAVVLENQDPDDADGDGISGRANRVWDRAAARTVLGRFGWKANQPSIEQQNAGAFVGDIGLTSLLFPAENCTAAQEACLAAPNGGVPEVDAIKLDAVTFYTRMLAVPARRDVADPTVQRGEALFHAIGCAGCHRVGLETGASPDAPALAAQRIHPYTDLLLHDMGADLADDRPDFDADGREWRTPPLWGIGLVHTVNRHTLFLHDGRARGFAEAILWHGGEGEAAREAFRDLSRDDRAALVRFLESL
ncbi:MAG: di-heme oxidoredictase family protein [Candidatus Binatia bacterium]